MSANKGFETKVPDDENTDSGFLSGPIDRFPDEVEDEEEAKESKDKSSDSGKVRSETEFVDLDSGLDLCLDPLRLDEETSPAPAPTPASARKQELPEGIDIPPLAFLFQQDDDGDTQLHIAAVHGCQKSASTLIRVCPDKYWLNLPNDFGHTALHLAVMSGHAVLSRMLVQAGASIGQRDLRGDTPIHVASRGKHVECLQALLAPVDNQRLTKNLATILNMKNYDGQTAVHLAAASGHLQTLQTLVYYGADVNARENLAGRTALHIAACRGDARMTSHLLERCAGVSARVRDYAGRTPRRLANKQRAFSPQELQRIFKPTAEDSDTESESEDDYDSDDSESLFDKIRSSMATAVLTN